MAKVFYSWQADTPRIIGKNLIHRALEDAINLLNSDADVEDAARDSPVLLDSDTSGEPGSPPIVQTIFAKIDAADVFVADLTFVGTRGAKNRPTPNPNVLIEYGWALKSLSHSRIVGVMNAAYGEPSREALPFDLGHLRFPLTYHCPAEADETVRQAERKALAKRLKDALKGILDLGNPSAPAVELFVPRPPLASRGRFRNVVEPIGRLYANGLQTEEQSESRVWLPGGACMWLRLAPKLAQPADLLSTDIEAALRAGGQTTPALNRYNDSFGAQGVRGSDGFGLCDSVTREHGSSTIVYAFTSGEIWSVDTAYLAASPSEVYFDEKAFTSSLTSCSAVLKRLGIAGPFHWIAGMEGVRGRRLRVANNQPTFLKPEAAANVVEVSGEFSGDAADAERALEPFFRRVFDNHQLTRP